MQLLHTVYVLVATVERSCENHRFINTDEPQAGNIDIDDSD